MSQTHQHQVYSGKRFEFGKNWQKFLLVIDEERITEAERPLREMLQVENLQGKSFLDIGCGSGLFSLAAMRLGARIVHSIDYDPQSVACAQELKRRFFKHTENWTIEIGNALDHEQMQNLGRWDIVYSWGVLHHTGNMWRALDNVITTVQKDGLLFISIYNDQGRMSKIWARVKILFNRSKTTRLMVLGVYLPYFILRAFAADMIRYRNPFSGYRAYKKSRGMSRLYDWLDWLGSYPFEVAKPEEIIEFCKQRDCILERLKTCGGTLGCNEFLLRYTGSKKPIDENG